MIENLKLFMMKKYNFDLAEYKVCDAKVQKNKFLLVPAYIFGVFLIGYILQATGLIPSIYNNIVIVIIVGVLLGMYQVLLIQKSKPESLVVTPIHFIKCTGKKTFVVILMDEIRRFKANDKEGLILSDKKGEISILPSRYQNDIEPIVEILEAKGKTFDKTREFMKRPIKVRIVKNRIIVKDLKIEESTTEKLVGQFYKEYKMLTPGFIRDIILLNSIVEEAYIDDNNLILKLDKIEVKEGHPENTGFDSIIAHDCITIFENIKIKKVTTKKARERGAVDEPLPKDADSILDNIEKGVVSNWKYRKTGIELILAAGTNILKVSFDYNEVIIGWNSAK